MVCFPQGGMTMRQLLNVNIYEPEGTVLICGTCLERMQPGAYARLAGEADYVYGL